MEAPSGKGQNQDLDGVPYAGNMPGSSTDGITSAPLAALPMYSDPRAPSENMPSRTCACMDRNCPKCGDGFARVVVFPHYPDPQPVIESENIKQDLYMVCNGDDEVAKCKDCQAYYCYLHKTVCSWCTQSYCLPCDGLH